MFLGGRKERFAGWFFSFQMFVCYTTLAERKENKDSVSKKLPFIKKKKKKKKKKAIFSVFINMCMYVG